jgi:hypothetical protein
VKRLRPLASDLTALLQGLDSMSTIHYGSNSQAECGAEDGLVSLKAAEVTCRTCRGWLPIVAPELQSPVYPTAIHHRDGPPSTSALSPSPAPEDEARVAWEAGFRLCRSYGDNHAHFDGEQKERRWLEYRLSRRWPALNQAEYNAAVAVHLADQVNELLAALKAVLPCVLDHETNANRLMVQSAIAKAEGK